MQRLFDAFSKAGRDLYLVGGAVRDLAMGGTVAELDDLDFTTNARPPETLEILERNGIRTYKLGIEFGTVGAVLSGARRDGFPKDVQITTYRSAEYYQRGSRHPVVAFGDTVDQDLARRDFSINSIAMGSSRDYIDPYGGLADIKSGTLRVVGDPRETLAEDPLRILRVARFMSRFGFVPTDDLRRAAYETASALLEISQQRWLQEMNKVLQGRHVSDALRFLHAVRALGVLLPEVATLIDLQNRWPGPPPHVDYWEDTLALLEASRDLASSWASLTVHIGRPWTRFVSDQVVDASVLFGLDSQNDAVDLDTSGITFPYWTRASALMFRGIAHRFHLDTATASAVEEAIRQHPRVLAHRPTDSDAEIRRLIRDLGREHAAVVNFARVVAQIRGVGLDGVDDLSARVEALAQAGRLEPSLPTGLGRVLIARCQLRAGPGVGEVIAWLREEIIDGRLDSDLDPEAYVHYLEEADPPALSTARAHQGPSQESKPRLG